MTVDYDALVQRQATVILVRSLCQEYAGKVSDQDLIAGVEMIYSTLRELSIESELCYCERLADDDVCDACMRCALGLD